MLPSHSMILAEAINTKILTKNHLDFRIPTLISLIPIIPLSQFPNSPIQFLQLTFKNVSRNYTVVNFGKLFAHWDETH